MPDVQADISMIRERLTVAEARGLAPDEQVAVDAVEAALRTVERKISTRRTPITWAQGSVIEAVYEQLHAARVMMVDVMDEVELRAEVPGVVASAQQVLHPDDPRRLSASAFAGMDVPALQASLRRLMDESYDAADRQYQQLRRFRNIVMSAGLLVFVLVVVLMIFISRNPSYFPLCFDTPLVPDKPADNLLNCPTAAGVPGPQKYDVVVLALLGLMGGVLSGIVTIRNLNRSAAPYDAPVALAFLKLPVGALTAVGGIALIQGGFVPGLTSLDTQNQILTYALLFGAAQHLITRLLDQKAQDLLDAVPAKGAGADPGKPTPPGAPDPTTAAVSAGEPEEGETDTVVAQVMAEPEDPEPEYAPSPYDDGDDDTVQDDESPVMPAAPEEDHS